MDHIKSYYKENKRNVFLTLGCILFNLILFYILIEFGDPIYRTNDDYRMRLIISGAYTGTPSAQAVFINPILAGYLAALYKLIPGVEWFGQFHMLSTFLPICTMECVLLCKSRSVSDLLIRIWAIVLYSAVMTTKYVLLPQFTTTSALWSMLALVALLELLNALKKGRRCEGWAVTFVISCIFAILVRKKVFLMTVPLIAFFCITFFLWNKRESCKPVFVTLVIMGALCGGCLVGNSIINSSDEYAAYSEFNSARSRIYDYTGSADYEMHKEFYDSIGFSKSAWENLIARTFDMNEEMTTENLTLIADYTESVTNNDHSFLLDIISDTNEALRFLMSNYVCRQILCLIALALLLSWNRTALKSARMKFLLSGSIFYVFACVFLFVYTGRIMDRLVDALIIIISPVLLALSADGDFNSEKFALPVLTLGKLRIPGLFGTFMALVLLCSTLTVSHFHWLRYDINAPRYFVTQTTKCIMALDEYMENNEDSFLFYNALDFIGGSEYVFGEHRDKVNIDSLGNWNVHSSTYNERNLQYGFTSAAEGLIERDNVFYAEIGGELHAPICSTLADAGKQLEIYDSFSVEGIPILIYKAVPLELSELTAME